MRIYVRLHKCIMDTLMKIRDNTVGYKQIGAIVFLLLLSVGLSLISIDIHVFSFPINLFLLLLLVAISFVLESYVFRYYVVSVKKMMLFATFVVLCLMFLYWLLYHRMIFSEMLPSVLYNFSTTALFIVGWLFFIIALGVLILRGIKVVNKQKFAFLFSHIGLWLALSAGFLGQADVYTLRANLIENNSISNAYNSKGVAMDLPFEVKLNKIHTEYYATGSPKAYVAHVSVYENDVVATERISINHPYRYKGYDMYLQKAGTNTCVLQIVYDPWRYVVFVGIISVLVGAILYFIHGIKYRTKNDGLE